jgi:hypothetical protein
MITPFDNPAVGPCPDDNCPDIPLVSQIRNRKKVAFSGAGRDQGEKTRKFPDRTPDREHTVFPELHPVDGICTDCVKIVMRQVDNMGCSRGNCTGKTGIFI